MNIQLILIVSQKFGSKVGLKKHKWRLRSGHKQKYLINYFERIGTPRYKGTKQDFLFFFISQHGG